jgi:NAD-dependent deacetylase
VWFGENLPQDVWRQAEEAVAACDMLIAVGTSGVVYPAAGLISAAVRAGKFVLELNPVPSELERTATMSWQVSAAVGLPGLVAALDAPPQCDASQRP